MILPSPHRAAASIPFAPVLFAAVLAGAGAAFPADEPVSPGEFRPAEVKEEHFAALKTSSPFTRSLNLSDSLILTGIATLESGEQVATLMNKETKETYVVSDQPNSQGWKMVEVAGSEELEKVSAKISLTGGQVVTVRYSEWQLKPGEAKPATGPAGEGPPPQGERPRFGDGHGPGPGFGPPPEVREKIMSLPEEKRRKLFEFMMKHRSENPDMSWEKRGKLMQKEIERLQKSD